ncbi:hypothetical protein SADUNF_Sadunf06G0106100 [Salix dunnii]|uniref:MLO-like protein n=1 Tax=Salix dunnii TaxID=1413687 RepID=A0A835K444_9ROSI|nr:hypothetical protein SADUNF_Sadunf06G0106100 [Salix dunnii]
MATEDTSIGKLEHTPTWALATVCLFFISVSIVLERIFHLLANFLRRGQRTALGDAVDKLKSELMLLGFMSLMLAVTQEPISKICIPANLADSMLPCRKEVESKLESSSDDPCSSKGKVSLISEKGIQQLHQFIFVLAVTQIVYSVLTMALGWTKMRRWKAWEKETQTIEYQVENDPNRFRLTRQTTFGRRHMRTCTNISALLWTKCFFRQFFHSVEKVDYLTLRHGFISAHLSARNANNFNFQKYIQRSLDEDLRVVVSVSPVMWFLVVILLLVDVHGWNVYLWMSCVPLLIVLLLGSKLQFIVAKMAYRINDENAVSRGAPLVQPNDDLFWFGHPRFVLVLIHYILFVLARSNAFGHGADHTCCSICRTHLSLPSSFGLQESIQFGHDSCYHENTAFTVTRVMGSQYKSKVLEEQVAKIIKKWYAEVRERRKKQNNAV